MNKIFSTSFNIAMVNVWLLIFRIAVSGAMLTHGYPKFQRLISGEPIKFADPFDIGAYPSFLLVVFAEFFCSIFIILGLGTRIASFCIIIAMSVAAFYAHADDPFGKKELALLYLVVFLTLLVFGPGRYSIDQAIAGPGKSKRRY